MPIFAFIREYVDLEDIVSNVHHLHSRSQKCPSDIYGSNLSAGVSLLVGRSLDADVDVVFAGMANYNGICRNPGCRPFMFKNAIQLRAYQDKPTH